jgi:hypothetical protein
METDVRSGTTRANQEKKEEIKLSEIEQHICNMECNLNQKKRELMQPSNVQVQVDVTSANENVFGLTLREALLAITLTDEYMEYRRTKSNNEASDHKFPRMIDDLLWQFGLPPSIRPLDEVIAQSLLPFQTDGETKSEEIKLVELSIEQQSHDNVTAESDLDLVNRIKQRKQYCSVKAPAKRVSKKSGAATASAKPTHDDSVVKKEKKLKKAKKKKKEKKEKKKEKSKD